MRKIAAALGVAILVPLGPTSTVSARDCSADPLPPVGTLAHGNQAAFDWNDDFGPPVTVHFRSEASCAWLAGTLWGPTNLASSGVLPGAIVIPPSGGASTQQQVLYIARTLASNGYIALTVDPQGIGSSDTFGYPPCSGRPGHSFPSPCENVPFQMMDNWMDTAHSALDFYLGPDNPWKDHVDPTHVGSVGHSLGARASSYLQDPHYDGLADTAPSRLAAVVALDNLSSDYYADAGAGGGGSAANKLVVGQVPVHVDEEGNVVDNSEPIQVRVPGLGIGSDTGGDPETKKTAYAYWKSRGVSSMEIVFAGAAHADFSQASTSDETFLHRVAYYTLAWFDRWLKGDTSAVDRLLSSTVVGGSPCDFLSTQQRSADYLPLDGRASEDLRSGC